MFYSCDLKRAVYRIIKRELPNQSVLVFLDELHSGYGSGGVNSYQDPGASWPTGERSLKKCALEDAEGNIFEISANTATSLTVAGTPASGSYKIYLVSKVDFATNKVKVDVEFPSPTQVSDWRQIIPVAIVQRAPMEQHAQQPLGQVLNVEFNAGNKQIDHGVVFQEGVVIDGFFPNGVIRDAFFLAVRNILSKPDMVQELAVEGATELRRTYSGQSVDWELANFPVFTGAFHLAARIEAYETQISAGTFTGFRVEELSASYTSPVDLNSPIDLSINYNVKIQIDDGTPVQVDCRGTTPASTSLAEIIQALNGALGYAAFETDANGDVGSGYLTIKSYSIGLGSQIVFSQPSERDTTETIFGLSRDTYPYTVTGAGGVALT